MIDIFDMIHYLIGFIILGFLIWTIIQVHNYFSQNNIPLETLMNKQSWDTKLIENVIIENVFLDKIGDCYKSVY